MKQFIQKLKNYIEYHLFIPGLQKFYTCYQIKRIRSKNQIRFLFVLQDLSKWKTEALYKAMMAHPRFEPILGITPPTGKQDTTRLEEYCHSKGYPYIILDKNRKLTTQVSPDIVAHQQPYFQDIHPTHRVRHNLSVPIVYIPYCIHSLLAYWDSNQYIHHYCWQHYFENSSCCEERKRIHFYHGKNFVVTGLPFWDELAAPKEQFPNPWPTDGRKRIIYAPHHTIGGLHMEGIEYSTFLENGEFMLEMAEKYKNKIYFVFKPHPRLYHNLVQIKGQAWTDAYYNEWKNRENCNIELGIYLPLFKHSDAMIHDCSSFTVEYLYMGKPAMYLLRHEDHTANISHYVGEAFDLHEKGRTHHDIERFIQQIITGEDFRKEAREQFYEATLQPPHGQSACANIIDAILGQGAYSQTR